MIAPPGDGSPPVLLGTRNALGAAKAIGDSHPALRAAAYAGLVAALLSLIPLELSFVIALPLGGLLSMVFYRRFAAGAVPPPRTGFKLGAVAGLFAFVLLLVLIAIGTLVPHSQNEIRDAVLQSFQRVQERTTDPQARQMLDYFMTSNGMAIVIVVGFVFMAIAFALLSGISGAVSARLLRRKDPPSGNSRPS